MPEAIPSNKSTSRLAPDYLLHSVDELIDGEPRSRDQYFAKAMELMLRSIIGLRGETLGIAMDRIAPSSKMSELTDYGPDFDASKPLHRLPPVSEDENIKAYKRELPRLLREHESQLVAFAEGELVAISGDRQELRKLALHLHPGQSVLITRIQKERRKFRALSPRRDLTKILG